MRSTARRSFRCSLVGGAGLPLLLMLAVACGSTVQNTGTTTFGAPGSAVSDGLGVPGTVAPDGSVTGSDGTPTGNNPGVALTDPTSVTSGTGHNGIGSAGTGTGTRTADAPGTGGGTSGAAAAQEGNVPGIENGFIKIGVVRVQNRGAAYEAVGAPGLAGSGYEERMQEALVKEINRTGIKGLKIKLVHHDVDANDASTPSDVRQQRMCAAWTQDDRVFAALAGEGEVLDACLARAGVVQVCGGCIVSTYDERQMAKVPLLHSPNGVSVDRQVDFYVKGLVEGGFFTGAGNRVPGPPKVGFLTYDDPVRKRQFPRLEAELEKRTGLTFAEHGFLPPPEGGDGSARALTALQNFLLQFKASGVNRILMLDNSGQAAAYGMQAADKNNYFPRWGFNSTSTPGGLFNAGVVPSSQLPGMTVVGWYPAADIGMKGDTQRPPGLAACLALFKKAGMTMSSDTDYGMAGVFCDQFFFLRDALEAAPALSAQQFGAGARSLGSSFSSSLTYAADQSAGRRDGGSIYRVGAYNAGCNCFRYLGGPRPTGTR